MDTTTLAVMGGATLAFMLIATALLTFGIWDRLRPPFFLFVGLVLLLVALMVSAPRLGADDTHAKSLATTALQQLGHPLKGELLCTSLSVFSAERWSCSAATEPSGVVITLHCGAHGCEVPVR